MQVWKPWDIRNRKIKSNTCNNYKRTFAARRKISFVSKEQEEKTFRKREKIILLVVERERENNFISGGHNLQV